MKMTLTFECGETTCASEPGKFCRFLYTKSFGTQSVCHLFDDQPLYDEDGWTRRCNDCLELSKEEWKPIGTARMDGKPMQLLYDGKLVTHWMSAKGE